MLNMQKNHPQKCSKILKNDITNFHLFKGKWEYITCIQEKYPFALIDNNELIHHAFNSNILCPCNKIIPKIMINNDLQLLRSQSNHKDSCNAYNFDIDREFEENVEIKPNIKYYEVHDFHKMKDIWNKNKSLSILHTNVCLLNANAEQLEILLHDLDFKFYILALTETWNPEKNNNNFFPKIIEGYQDYYGVTGSSGKGGCGVYINKFLNTVPRNGLEFKINTNDHEFESCWVEILNDKTPNILIGVIYRHPSKDEFNEHIKITLQKLKKENKKIIICGDFNLNLLVYNQDDYISTFLNIMLEHNFQPCITEPTRITNTNKPSLVDNIFINTLENPISGNILEHISYDHLPNFVILEQEKIDNTIHIKKRKTNNLNQDEFLIDLQNAALLHEIENANNSNMAYDIFHKQFILTLNKHAPIRYLSNKEVKLRQKPWLTNGILTSIKKKRTLFKKFKKLKI